MLVTGVQTCALPICFSFVEHEDVRLGIGIFMRLISDQIGQLYSRVVSYGVAYFPGFSHNAFLPGGLKRTADNSSDRFPQFEAPSRVFRDYEELLGAADEVGQIVSPLAEPLGSKAAEILAKETMLSGAV